MEIRLLFESFFGKMIGFKNKNLEIWKNDFVEKNLFREKRLVFVEVDLQQGFKDWRERATIRKANKHKNKTEIKKAKIKATESKKGEKIKTASAEKIVELQNRFKSKMAKLGIPLDENSNPVIQPEQPSPTSQVPEIEVKNPVEGVTARISILQKISSKDRKDQAELAERINNLLAYKSPKKGQEKQTGWTKKINNFLVGEGAKKNQNNVKLQEAGEGILREIVPNYNRPRSGNCEFETQKVVAMAVESALDEDILEKARNGDVVAEFQVAKKIEEIYDLLAHSRNRLHSKEIKKATRNKLGPILRGSENRAHREGLNRSEKQKKFEGKRTNVFGIEEDPSEKETDPGLFDRMKNAFELDTSKRVEDKLQISKWEKILFPVAGIHALAHFGRRGTQFLARNAAIRPINFAWKKALKPGSKFLWEKTFGKGILVGSARTALWVGGIVSGLPVIPVAVETAIWAGKKMKLGEKLKKVGGEAAYLGKNAAHLATLGIPRTAFGLLQKAWDKVKLPRKPKPETKK